MSYELLNVTLNQELIFLLLNKMYCFWLFAAMWIKALIHRIPCMGWRVWFTRTPSMVGMHG